MITNQPGSEFGPLGHSGALRGHESPAGLHEKSGALHQESAAF